MPHVELSSDLFQQIELSVPTGGTVNAFVREAVERKLADDRRRKEFVRFSDKMREAMHQKGLTEEQILAEFDSLRHSS
jgi:hypothetical protein